MCSLKVDDDIVKHLFVRSSDISPHIWFERIKYRREVVHHINLFKTITINVISINFKLSSKFPLVKLAIAFAESSVIAISQKQAITVVHDDD